MFASTSWLAAALRAGVSAFEVEDGDVNDAGCEVFAEKVGAKGALHVECGEVGGPAPASGDVDLPRRVRRWR